MKWKTIEEKREYERQWRLNNPEAQKAINKRRNQKYSAKRMEIIKEAKNKPCIDCKVKYPYFVMDFDHLRDKKFDIARSKFKYTFEELKEEIAKCDVVCSNCHRIRTHLRKIKSLGVATVC